MGGGLRFRFPSWTEWIDGSSSGGVESLLVCQDHVAKWQRCRLRSETSSGILVGPIQAPHSRSPPCTSLLWQEKAVSPWPRHLFAHRTVPWRWSRTWWKSPKTCSSKWRPSRSVVTLIGTLVKNDTMSKLTIMSWVSTWSELKSWTNSMEFFMWWVARVAAE
jgi:hypothetical protein